MSRASWNCISHAVALTFHNCCCSYSCSLRHGATLLLGLLFNQQQIHFFYLSSWSSCIFCPGHVDSPNLQNCAKTVGQKLRKFDVYFLLIHNSIDALQHSGNNARMWVWWLPIELQCTKLQMTLAVLFSERTMFSSHNKSASTITKPLRFKKCV